MINETKDRAKQGRVLFGAVGDLPPEIVVSVYGYGSGSGSGDGYGDGYGSGYCNGSGYGDGRGDGYGSGES